MRLIISIFLLFLLSNVCFAKNIIGEGVGAFEDSSKLSKAIYMWRPTDKQSSEVLRLSKRESYCGKSSLEVHTFPPKGFGIFLRAGAKEYKAGETYTASAYVKSKKPITLLIYLTAYDKLWGKNKGIKFSYSKISNDWQQLKVTFTLLKDAKILGTIIRAGGTAKEANIFYVDEVKIEKGNKAAVSVPDRVESIEMVNLKGVIPVAEAPVIDGKLDDLVWENALTVNKFYLTDGSGKVAPQATEVKLLHDGKNIYFGFKCNEKNPSAVKCASTQDKVDWNDDRVEIHANPQGYASPSAYFSVNADGVHTTKMPFSKLNLKAKVKTAKGNGFWTAEIAIPAAVYGKRGLIGQTWYFSLGRFHRTSFKGASCLAPIKGGFNQQSEAFLPFAFSGHSGKLPPALALSQGDMAGYSNNTSANAIVFQLNDKKLLKRDLQLIVTSTVGGKTVGERSVSAKPPYNNNLAVFYYNVAGKENENLNFILKSGSKTIFSSKNYLKILCPSSRAFKTVDPLFKELLENAPAEKRTFISWQQPIMDDNYSLALKYGKPYSQDIRMRELKDAGISIITKDATSLYKKLPSVLPGNYYWDRQKFNMDVLTEKVRHGLTQPFTVYAYYSISGVSPDGKKGIILDKNGYFGWLPDPINSQAYKDSVKAVLDKYGIGIGMMWVGDEQFWLQYNKGLKMNSPHNLANPSGFLSKADQEVKEKYGFNKFGIPWKINSKSPSYPYCRRAYISWLHDKLLTVNKDVRAIVKAKYPNMPVLSDDAYGIPSLVGVQYWNQYADIGTYQLGEGGGTTESETEAYAFTTKMVKDLSGIKKLLVVPHEPIDGYPSGATTIEEARELYSQTLRGGAAGFHYWPSSYGGRTRPNIYAISASEGYPQAWEYMLEVSKLLNSIPPLKFPKNHDTAIFVSDEALKCDSSGYNRFPVAFYLLGTSARSWFKFISDTMLEQKRAKLRDYKIVYMPYIQYVKEDTIKKLISYVENGGILICGDPKAFENDISSASLAQYREKLFGVKSITQDKSEGSSVCYIGKSRLPVGGSRFLLALEDKVNVLGRYADGSPAVVEKRYGKGKAVYFGFVPFNRIAVSNDKWKKFFKELQISAGCSVDHKIWRFKLPEPKVKAIAPPEGKCLTGNYAYWNRHRFNDGAIFNLKLDGVCEIKRNGKIKAAKFKKSRLTDRKSIFTRVKEYTDGSPDKFVETFARPGSKSITIDLKKKYPLSSLVLYYAGDMPEIKVSVSNDKRSWDTAGRIPEAKTVPLEVKEVKLSFTNANSRYIKLDFSIQAGKKLILAECELWQK